MSQALITHLISVGSVVLRPRVDPLFYLIDRGLIQERTSKRHAASCNSRRTLELVDHIAVGGITDFDTLQRRLLNTCFADERSEGSSRRSQIHRSWKRTSSTCVAAGAVRRENVSLQLGQRD